MAIAAAAFAPPPPMDPTDKQKYRTRLASSGTAGMNLHVSVGAHNLRILKKATGGAHGSDTPVSTPTPTSAASKQRKYERKSKRFLWPDELHRLFVAAIFDIGLKNASPKALLSIMSSAGASGDLTTEHLKSHLQKYRLNYERSRLEFLEFYDESARRSHKRRRKSSASRSSDPNGTAFVFPISHKRQRGGENGSSDEDDSSEVTSDMEDESPTESPRDNTPRPVVPSKAAVVKTEFRQVQGEARRRNEQSPAPKTAPSTGAAKPVVERQSSQPPTPTYAAPIQPYQPQATAPLATSRSEPTGSGSGAVIGGISDRMVAAAAAAAVAAVPFGNLGTLNDPQWNILNSLISPQLSANRGPSDGTTDPAGASTAPTTAAGANGKLPGGFEPFSLSGVEAADLQMQMHMAMQAQMNLHRQMLTRKVEVSQHLHNQQQQQQQTAAGKPSGVAIAPGHTAASWSADANTFATSKPLTPATVSSQAPSTVLSDLPSSRLLNSMLASDGSSSSTFAASSAFSQATASLAVAAAPSADESSVSSTLLGLQGSDFVDAAALASLEAVGASDKMDEGESLADLYRWDKMDFSMDIDDDDLFGFLKS